MSERPSTLQPLPPERWAEARRLYEEEELSVAAIADRTGISRSALFGKVKTQGWGRGGTGEEAGAEPSAQAAAGAFVATSAAALALRLQRFVADRVAALEAAGTRADRDPERTARAVTALVRAFGELDALRQKIDLEPLEADAPPARSLAELRDLVADRLMELRMQAQRRAKEGGLARGGSPAAMRGMRLDVGFDPAAILRRRR